MEQARPVKNNTDKEDDKIKSYMKLRRAIFTADKRNHGKVLIAAVAEWVRAWDTLTMFEAMV